MQLSNKDLGHRLSEIRNNPDKGMLYLPYISHVVLDALSHDTEEGKVILKQLEIGTTSTRFLEFILHGLALAIEDEYSDSVQFVYAFHCLDIVRAVTDMYKIYEFWLYNTSQLYRVIIPICGEYARTSISVSEKLARFLLRYVQFYLCNFLNSEYDGYQLLQNRAIFDAFADCCMRYRQENLVKLFLTTVRDVDFGVNKAQMYRIVKLHINDCFCVVKRRIQLFLRYSSSRLHMEEYVRKARHECIGFNYRLKAECLRCIYLEIMNAEAHEKKTLIPAHKVFEECYMSTMKNVVRRGSRKRKRKRKGFLPSHFMRGKAKEIFEQVAFFLERPKSVSLRHITVDCESSSSSSSDAQETSSHGEESLEQAAD